MPFFCMYCTLVKQRNEIDTLKDIIKTFSNEISAIEASQKLNAPQFLQSVDMESSDVINHTAIQHTPSTATTESISKPPSKGIPPGEHKFNLVIYGIAECLLDLNDISPT